MKAKIHTATWISIFLPIAIISIITSWLATAGTFNHYAYRPSILDDLANSFLAGQTHLLEKPAPELLAKAHPFDPSNVKLWKWDISLYEGKYYLYWGPIGSLVIAAKKLIFNTDKVLDSEVTLYFSLLRVFFGSCLILLLHQRHYSSSPLWTAHLGIVLFALSAPYPTIVGRPLVYEATIMIGQCFLAGGLLFLALSLFFSSSSFRRIFFGATAGIFLGCSFASRMSLVLAVSAVYLISLGYIIWGETLTRVGSKHRVNLALSIGFPICLSGLLLGIYNYVRFGSPFESGWQFQLTTMPGVLSPSYIPYNLVQYFLKPPQILHQFPYIEATWSPYTAFGINHPSYFWRFPVIGLAYLSPFLCMAVLTGTLLLVKHMPRISCRKSLPYLNSFEGWVIISSAGITLFAAVPVLTMFASLQRYMGDFVGSIVLISLVCYWRLLKINELRRVTYKVILFVGLFSGICSGILAVLAGLGPEGDVLKTFNASLLSQIQSYLPTLPFVAP